MPASVFSRAGMHTSGFYVAYFMATGAHMPFWPLWLGDWGLSAVEVAYYGALGTAVRLVAGLGIPALADRLDARRHTVAAAALAGAALFLGHLGIEGRPALLVLTLATGAVFAGVGPIGEALGAAAARDYGFHYAQARALGSVGYLGANLLVGALIPLLGTDVALWWIVACFLAMVALARGHPGGGRVKGHVPPSLREIGRLFLHPVFALFVAAIAFCQAGHAVYYALGSVHWRALGLGEARIGALWAASVAAEVVFMFTIGAATVRVLGPVRAIALSGIGGILRWGAMMLDPTGLALWPLQGLHVLTFALGHLGAMAFIAQAVPPRLAAAAMGAMGAMAVGLVLAIGMALAGALYPSLGGRSYGIGMVLAGLGLGLSVWLDRRWRGQTLAL